MEGLKFLSILDICKKCFIFVCETQDKKSQYKGVYYRKQTGKWNVLVYCKGEKSKYGGLFNDELDAAKRVNQVCEELKIPLRNPGIIGMSNQVTQNFFLY